MLPIRSNMGNDGKRMSIGRKLVNDYMAEHTVDVKGDVMEIGRNVYSKLVPKDQVKSYTCLDIDEFEDVDIVADIQKMPQVADDSFDSIICTQVLEHVRNPFKAIDELHRVLRPGGRLIIAVPFLNNYHMVPHDYWRYTEYGLKNLLNDFSSSKVQSLGSTYHHVLATLGYGATEVDINVKERTENTPKFPVIIGAIAIK